MNLPDDYLAPSHAGHPECQPCQFSMREDWPGEAWWIAICDHHLDAPSVWRAEQRNLYAGLVAAYQRGDDLKADEFSSVPAPMFPPKTPEEEQP